MIPAPTARRLDGKARCVINSSKKSAYRSSALLKKRRTLLLGFRCGRGLPGLRVNFGCLPELRVSYWRTILETFFGFSLVLISGKSSIGSGSVSERATFGISTSLSPQPQSRVAIICNTVPQVEGIIRVFCSCRATENRFCIVRR